MLERADAQVTLKTLGERLLEAAADAELAARGFAFTLEPIRERRALVQAAGSYSSTASSRAWRATRRLTSTDRATCFRCEPTCTRSIAHEYARRELYRCHAPGLDFEERLDALVEGCGPGQLSEGVRTAARHRLARRLLDDAVTYHDELSDDERQYLATQRGPLSARLAQAAGLTPELRAEGVALVDLGGELSDAHLPAVGTEAHVTLLVAEHLAAGARERPGALASLPEIAAFVRAAMDQYGRFWRKGAREPGAEQALAEQAVAQLERLKLVRRVAGSVEARPALLRYDVGEAQLQRSPARQESLL